jgi:hypothetical protein
MAIGNLLRADNSDRENGRPYGPGAAHGRRDGEIGAFMTAAADDVMVNRARATHHLKLASLRHGLERDRDRVRHASVEVAAEAGLSIVDGLFLGYARQIIRFTPSLGLERIAREAGPGWPRTFVIAGNVSHSVLNQG